MVGHHVDHDAHPAARRLTGQGVERGGAAEVVAEAVVVDDVVAVGGSRSRLQDGGQVDVGHPERVEVLEHLLRVVEAELRAKLQAVGAGGRRRGHQTTRRSTRIERASTVTGSPARAERPVRDERCGRVGDDLPPLAVDLLRHGERHVLVVGVEQQQERVVDDRLTAGRRLGDGVAVEEHRQRLGVAVAPVVTGHVLPRRGEPGDVADLALRAERGVALEEPAAAEHGVVVAQLGDRAR